MDTPTDKTLIDALLKSEIYINELTKIVWVLMYACAKNGILNGKEIENILENAKKMSNL